MHAHHCVRARTIIVIASKWLPAAQPRVVSFCLFSLLDPRLKWRIYVIDCARGKYTCMYDDALASERLPAFMYVAFVYVPVQLLSYCFQAGDVSAATR